MLVLSYIDILEFIDHFLVIFLRSYMPISFLNLGVPIIESMAGNQVSTKKQKYQLKQLKIFVNN